MVADQGSALDRQTANLDQANGRTADVVGPGGLVELCDQINAEIRAQTVAATARRPWWKLWGRT